MGGGFLYLLQYTFSPTLRRGIKSLFLYPPHWHSSRRGTLLWHPTKKEEEKKIPKHVLSRGEKKKGKFSLVSQNGRKIKKIFPFLSRNDRTQENLASLLGKRGRKGT